MKCAITAQSVQTEQTVQLHLGNNKTLAQLKVCIVMSIHNMEKVVALNMLMANFPKYLNNCTDCAFHKFAMIALIALIAHFITFSLLILTFHGVNGKHVWELTMSWKTCDYFD